MSAGQPPIDSPEIRRLTPVIGPGYTYGSVTDKISSIVLTRPTSLGWFAGFAIAFSVMGMMTIAIGWLIIKGTGNVSAVKVNGKTDGPFASCMLGKMQTVTFPKFNGAKTHAAFSLAFK